MGSHKMLMQLIFLWVLLAAILATAALAAQAKPGCQSSCGDVTIPYPFGTSDGCYVDRDFRIACNTTSDPPIAYLSEITSNIQVLNISLKGELRVSVDVAYECYNESGARSYPAETYDYWLTQPRFFISHTKNKFTAVGCDTIAYIDGFEGRTHSTGCLSLCYGPEDVSNGSCSGIGCCQATIPNGVKGYKIEARSFNNHSYVMDFNPCSYAFVVEDGAFNFSSLDIFDLRKKSQFPSVLNWAIGNETCSEAKKNRTSYRCMENTNCTDSENGPGYLCSCLDGFQGNPYLPNGCQDIEEYEKSPCNSTATCINLPGKFTCSCPKGYEGDGLKHGKGFSPKVNQSKRFSVTDIALVIAICVLVQLLGITWLCWGLKTRKQIKLRQKFFEQNGGIMLEQQLSQLDGSSYTTKIFTAKDLIKATNNYHESRILGRGSQGTVYRGIIDNKEVAIKVSKGIDKSQVEQFVNEVIVLSRINHRNVVKLLGCCLETPVPRLVYQYVTNGTLSEHIHNVGQISPVPWETRLKIATEAAGAISYLHSAASIPIIHRDIKSANILLDNNFTTKVSDFGSSRLIPLDHTQLTTLVQGTLGYLDPEYMQTSQLSEKSDVYSFGVVLMELLTGKKALSSASPEAERVLALYVVSMMQEDRLFEVLDHKVLNERNVEQLKEVAKLARSCVRVNGAERPTMREVANALESLRAVEQRERVKGDMNSEENEFFDGELPNTYRGGSRSPKGGYDSIGNQVPFELDGGR